MERDNREEASEHKRLLYVAATRAADKLYLSGDDPRRQTASLAATAGWPTSSTPWENPTSKASKSARLCPSTWNAIARRSAPSPVAVPSADDEQDIMPPLVARPPVIPLRSSTPVTALRKPPSHAPARHGDGLALFRGTLAHRAIELWFTSGERPRSSSFPRRSPQTRLTGRSSGSPLTSTPCSTYSTPVPSRQRCATKARAPTSSCLSPGTGTEHPYTGRSTSPTRAAAPGT